MRILTGRRPARADVQAIKSKQPFLPFCKANRSFVFGVAVICLGLGAGVLAACRLQDDKALFLQNCLRLFFFQPQTLHPLGVYLSFLGMEICFFGWMYLSGFLPFGRLFPFLPLFLKSGCISLLYTAMLRWFEADGMLGVYGVNLLPDFLGLLIYLWAAGKAGRLANQMTANCQKEQTPQPLYPAVAIYRRNMLLPGLGLLCIVLAKTLLALWLLPNKL